jgi:hypothetical protein
MCVHFYQQGIWPWGGAKQITYVHNFLNTLVCKDPWHSLSCAYYACDVYMVCLYIYIHSYSYSKLHVQQFFYDMCSYFEAKSFDNM